MLKNNLIAQREMIRRLPWDYSYSKTEALALVRQHIPDFTETEFNASEDAWKIDWIYDHGIPRYFDRFFESLCKTDAAFAKRAGVETVGADGQDAGQGRLDRAIGLDAGKRTNDMPHPLPRQCENEGRVFS